MRCLSAIGCSSSPRPRPIPEHATRPECRICRESGYRVRSACLLILSLAVIGCPVSAARAEQGGDAIAGERGSAAALTPGHLLVRDESVGHGLLGGLHGRREERVHLRPGDEPELVVVTLGARPRGVAAEPTGVRGGEGEEQ